MRTLAGRYEVREKLRTGENLVYRAWDDCLTREVAVKLFPAGSDTKEQAPFTDGVLALAKVAHPNLIEFGYFEVEGEQKPFCVMPYVHGTTLDKLLDEPGRGPLSVARVIALTTGVARGLHAIHQIGLVHRDLKPSNILVMSDDSVKVLNFGIDPDGLNPYVAPEQLDGRLVSASTDVFPLVVIVYEALTGQHPFARDTETETFQAILTETPIPVHEIRPEACRGISAVVTQTMAKAPEQRFAAPLDMLRAREEAERHVEAPAPDWEALLGERFRLLTVKYSDWLSPSESARLSAIEGELAEIEGRESQEFEAIFPETTVGRLELSLDRFEQYVLTLKRAEQ